MCTINKLNLTFKINQICIYNKIFIKNIPKICKHEYINMLYKPKIKAIKKKNPKSLFSKNRAFFYSYF